MCEYCNDRIYDEYDGLRDGSMKIDVDRLREELRFITIFPEKWDQSLWFSGPLINNKDESAPPHSAKSACGSFGCIAGNTVAHQDLDLMWYKQAKYDDANEYIGYYWACNHVYIETQEEFEKRLETLPASQKRYAERWNVPIREKAEEILGLSERQADSLFGGLNDLDELWEMASRFTNDQITEDDYEAAKAQRVVQELKEQKEGR